MSQRQRDEALTPTQVSRGQAVPARPERQHGHEDRVHETQAQREQVSADPTLLQRALANLFDNAKKHGHGADVLEVTVSAGEVKFDVLDRGPGITGDGQALFKKFNRGQDGEGANGLGLGLALVKRIADAHGGAVWAVSRDGGGAKGGFSVKR